MTLLILAAGSGSRYGGNKQFDGVGPNGEYLMEYNIYDAIEAGFSKIVVVTRSEFVEDTSAYFKNHLPASVEFMCVTQSLDDIPSGFELNPDRLKPWGTAHAVWSARNEVDGRFLMVNADDFYGRSAFRVAHQDYPEDTFGLIAYTLNTTLSQNGSVSRGVCMEENEFLREVIEHTKISKQEATIVDEPTGKIFSGGELVSMNMWMLDETIFPIIEKEFIEFLRSSVSLTSEIYIPFVIQSMIEKGKRVKVSNSESEWMGLTYPGDKQEVKEKIQEYTNKGTYPSPLWG